MRTIKTGKNYELKGQVTEYAPGLFNLELHQLFPEAQRPHWRRILQLNLSRDELDTFRGILK